MSKHTAHVADRSWTADQAVAQTWVDIGEVFTIPPSTTAYYELTVLETQPGFSSSGGEGSLTAPASAAKATVELAVTRDATTGITITQDNQVANTTGWQVGKVNNTGALGVPAFVGAEIRAIDDGAGGWKLQQRVGNTQAASSASPLLGAVGVRSLASVAWSSATTKIFGAAVCSESYGTSWTMNTGTASIFGISGVHIGKGAAVERIIVGESGTKCSVTWRSSTDALGLTIAADASDADITSVGTMDVTSGGNCTISATGSLSMSATTIAKVAGTTKVQLCSDGDLVELCSDTAGTVPRVAFQWANPDPQTTNDTITTLLNVDCPARPKSYIFRVHVRDASLNMASWTKEVRAVLRGGTSVIIGTAYTNVAPDVSDAALSGCLLTISAASTLVRARGTGIAATTLDWSVSVEIVG